jgi:predicted acyl esterase
MSRRGGSHDRTPSHPGRRAWSRRHVHRRRLPLHPGVPESLDIEIWPTSIVLRPGDTLTVEISDNDDQMAVLAHDDSHDRGDQRLSGDITIHTGGPYDSHLLAPVVPPRG